MGGISIKRIIFAIYILIIVTITASLSGCITINIGSQTPPQASPLTPSITVQPNLGKITGTVLDQNKVQTPRVRVTLWKDYKIVNIQNNPQITSADGNSKYSFDNVPSGVYTISAEKEGNIGYTVVTVYSNTIDTRIVLQSYSYIAQSSTSGNPTLEPSWSQPPIYRAEYDNGYSYNGVSYGIVTGRVIYSDGRGISNANVTLWQNGNIVWIPENPQLSNDGRTASIGAFLFYRVPFGTYTLSVDKGGPASKVNIIVNSGTAYTGDVVLV